MLMSILNVTLTLVAAVLIFCIGYVRWIYGYWQRRNVVAVSATFPFGSLTHLFTKKRYIGDIYEDDYNYIKSKNVRFGGVYVFTSPALMLVDLDLIKDVTTKSFYQFNDRGFYCNEKHDPLSAHLLNLTGEKWKKMRSKLTCAFTPAKIKMMFNTITACCEPLLNALEKYADDCAVLDADEVMARFTTDVIGSCAFGIECNSFKGSTSEFRKYGDEVMRPSMFKVVLLALGEMNKKLGNRLGITRTTPQARKFFLDIVSGTIAYRKKHKVARNDFMQILIDLNEFTLCEMAAQVLLFFVAGFETSASTLTFCLYELAKHPEIQKRLRNEITEVLGEHQNISFEAVNDMPYLCQVIDETLRKYPPAGIVARMCIKDYRVPNSDLVVKVGTKVLIPIQGLHRDPKYYPQPDVFDPERFNDENRKKIKPFTYLPFGEGPRSCLGAKFATAQAKIALVTMLNKFQFSLNAKTPAVLKGYYGTISLTFPKSVWLDVKKLEISV
ncbi:hypothetical protein FQR65_LT12417 [Abscondita terminalis]|nr:hypothetical protein FQR65_LT12417 [Abscondita terminalis]